MVQIPKSSVPKDFICPITNEIMEDPVFDPMFDAVSFERKAVLRRLKEKGQAYCPVSGYPLTAEALVSNTKFPATSNIFTLVPLGKLVPFLPSMVTVL